MPLLHIKTLIGTTRAYPHSYSRGVFPLNNVDSILHPDLGSNSSLNRVPTSTIILGRSHFSSNVGSSLQTRMSVYKYVGKVGQAHFQFVIAFLLCFLIPHPQVETTYMRQFRSRIERIADVRSSPLILCSHYENMWLGLIQDPTSNMSVETHPNFAVVTVVLHFCII